MKARRLISFIMLSVYLMSICGTAVVVLSCHCSHTHYIVAGKVVTCACHSCGDAVAATGCENTFVESDCNCGHDHSTDIELYSADDYRPHSVAPSVSVCIIASADKADIATKVARHTYNIRGDLPLPCSPHADACGLRAPPVFA